MKRIEQMKNIDNENIIFAFAALGSKPRLLILKHLLKSGKKGASIDAINEQIKIPLSTLAHHLRSLKRAGLINQKQDGLSTLNFVNLPEIKNLSNFIRDELR